MGKARRKRRSFFEPESKTVVNWMDSQHNLGVSLQLIIVDAIHKYGKGDALEVHLSQRDETVEGNITVHAKNPNVILDRIINNDNHLEPTIKEEPQEEEVTVEKEVKVKKEKPVKQKVKSDDKKEVPIEEEDEYNPLDVMFGDANSKLEE